MKSESDVWNEINQQFEKIKQMSGIEPDKDYAKNLEELLSMDFSEMTEEMVRKHKSVTLEVEQISTDSVVPYYNYQTDSGFDLFSIEQLVIPPFGRKLVSTGIKLGIPDGFEIQIRPKSGLALNMGITVLNTPGTIDEGYTVEIQVIVFNTNNHEVTIDKGMKVAQAVLCPVMSGKYVGISLVDTINNKDRGSKGFGHTGIRI
jgi:dUTP pyrophosphatase